MNSDFDYRELMNPPKKNLRIMLRTGNSVLITNCFRADEIMEHWKKHPLKYIFGRLSVRDVSGLQKSTVRRRLIAGMDVFTQVPLSHDTEPK